MFGLEPIDYGWGTGVAPPYPGAIPSPNPTNPTVPLPNPTNNTSPWGLGWEWLTGSGPREQQFYDGDPFAEMLRKHKNIQAGINRARERAKENCTSCNNNAFDVDVSYDLGGIQGVPKYFSDYSTLLTGGLTGNLAVTYLGSYSGTLTVSGISCCHGTGKYTIIVTNRSHGASALRPPVLGYTEWWQNNIATKINDLIGTDGPTSPTKQTITLTGELNFDENQKCKD